MHSQKYSEKSITISWAKKNPHKMINRLTEDDIITALHTALKHLDARMLFVDFHMTPKTGYKTEQPWTQQVTVHLDNGCSSVAEPRTSGWETTSPPVLYQFTLKKN